MEHPIVRALGDYWDGIRGGRLAPYRGDVDPRAISRVLPHAFILERTEDGQLRYRLAGTRLCESFGAELRGMNPLALWRGACRLKLQDVLRRVLDTPAIGRMGSMVESEGGHTQRMEHIYLPMRDNAGEMNRIIGCATPVGVALSAGRIYRPVAQFITESSWEPVMRASDAPPEEPLTARPWASVAAHISRISQATRTGARAVAHDTCAGRPALRLIAIDGARIEDHD